MPRYTISSLRQIDWLRANFPESPNRYSWDLWFSAECTRGVLNSLSRLAARQKLERWWTVDPVNLP